MYKRPASALRIKWPYRDHDDLKWYKNPLRCLVPPFAGVNGKFFVKNFQYWKVVNEQTIINHVNPVKPRSKGLITFGNHQCTIDDCFVWSR